MNVLLAEPTQDQFDLIQTIWEGHESCGQWPIFQYVEARAAERRRDALAILRSFPQVGHKQYSAVWFDQAGNSTPDARSQVKLTVAGLRHVTTNMPLTEDFVQLVRYLVEVRRSAPYAPNRLVTVKATRAAIAEALYPGTARDQCDARMNTLHGMLRLEPATWMGAHGSPRDNEWWPDLGPQILAFADIADVKGYLDRVWEMYAPPQAPPLWTPPPQDALVKAVDYLDAVWRARFGKPLLVLHSAERTAKLASDADDSDAFDSRLTALADLLAHLQVIDVSVGAPGDTHPLSRLAVFLPPRLSGANAARIEAALNTLRLVKDIRNGMQHANASAGAASALVELGIDYPVVDWQRAWNIIRARSAEAFDTVREEIQVTQRAT